MSARKRLKARLIMLPRQQRAPTQLPRRIRVLSNNPMLARIGIVAIFIALPLGLRAQQPADQKPTIVLPPVPTGRLSGYISCADTHRPARGAVVLISSLGDKTTYTRTVRTGIDGRYFADHLPPGEYTVWSYYPGYISREELVPGYTDPQHAAAWSKARDAVIGDHRATIRDGGAGEINEVLERGVAFTGRVLYSDGTPATQVTMFVQPAEEAVTDKADDTDDSAPTVDFVTADRETRMEFTHQSIITDDRGNFRVAGLPAGAYTVGAAMPPPDEEAREPMHGTRAEVGLMPGTGELVEYAGKSGSTLHLAQARTWKLASGEEAHDIEITLPTEGFHTVSGHLLAPDGRPLNLGDLTLTDVSDDDLSFAAAPVRRDGSFTFYNIPNGSYRLEATSASIGILNPRWTTIPTREEYMDFVPDEDYDDGSMPVLVADHDVTDLVFTLKKSPPEPVSPDKPQSN